MVADGTVKQSKNSDSAATKIPSTNAGAVMAKKLIPLARQAVISLSADIRP